MNEHHGPEPTPTVAELPRVERPEPHAPEPEMSFDGQLDLRGVKVRAVARGPGIAALQRVLIVLVLVVGAVLIVRSFRTPQAARPEDLGRCTERIQRTEVIELTCTRDGS